MDNNRTDEFLSRFLTLLNDSDVPDVQITDDSTIGDSFKTLGFDMDCGHGFEEKWEICQAQKWVLKMRQHSIFRFYQMTMKSI